MLIFVHVYIWFVDYESLPCFEIQTFFPSQSNIFLKGERGYNSTIKN